MRTVTRNVYYCDHCKRHRLTAAAIEGHEPKCIYNPGRSKCGWHDADYTVTSPSEHTAALKATLDLDVLRESVEGCPACMLAVYVQAELTTDERDEIGFTYGAEVERFRAVESRAAAGIW